jgi:uncharacterized membrane protein
VGVRVRVLGSFACAAALCVPRIAHGEGPAENPALAVALDYAAPGDCFDADDFKSIVIGRLGYEAFRDDAENHVHVRIAPHGRGFEGRIEWQNTEGKWIGERLLLSRNDSCLDLDRAMAFALALQIQLVAITQASPGKSPPAQEKVEAGPPAPPVSPSVPSENVTSASERRAAEPETGPAFAIGAGALLGLGLSSTAAPLGRLFASLQWTHLSLELAAEAAWRTTTRRDDGAGFSQQVLLGDVAGCGILASWQACLLGKVGQVRVAGENVDSPASPSGSVVETGLRLAVTQALGRHAFVAAQVEGLVNVMLWRVTLDQVPVWTSPRFAGSLGINVGFRLW